MLMNGALIGFAQRVARETELRAKLEADFEGTLQAEGLQLWPAELESLRASFRFLRAIDPVELDSRIAAGGGPQPMC